MSEPSLTKCNISCRVQGTTLERRSVSLPPHFLAASRRLLPSFLRSTLPADFFMHAFVNLRPKSHCSASKHWGFQNYQQVYKRSFTQAKCITLLDFEIRNPTKQFQRTSDCRADSILVWETGLKGIRLLCTL